MTTNVIVSRAGTTLRLKPHISKIMQFARKQSRFHEESPVRVSFDPLYQASGRHIEQRQRHMMAVARSIHPKTEAKTDAPVPPGLRGRQIGMYYAKLSKQRRGDANDASKRRRGDANDAFLDMFAVPSLRHVRADNRLFTEPFESGASFDFKMHSLAKSFLQRGQIPRCEASSDAAEDEWLYRRRLENPSPENLRKVQQSLPAFNLRKQIVQVIEDNPAVIITGETGCGKSTQVPQYILDEWILHRKRGSECRILCAQPRRICATSLASRVSAEWGDPDAVGYHIRFDASLPRPTGSITFCTTGIALKYIECDEMMSPFSHIIVDEVHERAIESELLLIFLKNLLEKRDDVRVILMSASVQAEKFSAWLNDAPLLDIPARRFEVTSYFLEDIIDHLQTNLIVQSSQTKFGRDVRMTDQQGYESRPTYRLSPAGLRALETIERSERVNYVLVSETVSWLLKSFPRMGSILVFVPGMSDISKCAKELLKKNPRLHILPLHSLLPSNMQSKVFDPAPDGKVKVVLSTNIAESSITIDDIDAVVDCGLSKQEGFDVSIGTRLLQQSLITKSSVCQRKGRAGRVRNGICVHLYTRWTHDNKMAEYPVSGLLNSRLDQVILQVKASGYTGDIRHFLNQAVDRPGDDLVDSSVEFLHNIAALDRENGEQLTPCGYLLSQLPCDSQIAKMVLFGALFHCLDPIITIAAFLSAQDPFFVIPGQEAEVDKARRNFLFASEGPAAYSDHLMLLRVFKEWLNSRSIGEHRDFCERNFLSESKLWNARNVRNQLRDLVKSFKFLDFRRYDYNRFSDKIDLVSFVLAVSLYPNIATVKSVTSEKRPISLKTGTNRSLTISQRSACYGLKLADLPSIYFIYFEKVKNSSGTVVYDLSPVSPLSLLFCARHFQTVGKVKNNSAAKETFTLDHWLPVKVNGDDLAKIISLRRTFDQIVEGIIVEPNPIDIDSDSKIAQSIRTIVDAVCCIK